MLRRKMSEIIRLPGKQQAGKIEKPNTIKLRDKEKLLKNPSRQTVLLIDGSDSMGDSKRRFATSGAVAFAEGALAKNYSVAVIGFANDARLICKPTTDLERIRKACGCWPVSGGTFIGAGLDAAVNLGVEPGDVLVVTDGACGQPDKTLSIASKLKDKKIEILAVGTDDADQVFLQQLASRPDLGLKVEIGKFASAISNASKLLKG
jgi:Mg-chelatase subunit ChlD